MKLTFVLPLLCALPSVLSAPVSPDPNKEDFKPLSEIQAEALECQIGHYCSKKMSFEKICYALKENVNVPQVIGFAANVLTTACMLHYAGDGDNVVKGILIGGMSSIQSSVTSMFNGFSSNHHDQETAMRGFRQLFGILKKDFEKKKKTMDPSVVSLVQSIDREIMNSWYGGNKDNLIDLIKRRETIILGLPQMAKNVAHYEPGGDHEKLKELDSKLNQFISRVPEKNREHLANLIMRIRDNSIPGAKSAGQVQAYFHGPPGTGKTWFTRSLAETLGLPLCEIVLKNDDNSDLTGGGGYTRNGKEQSKDEDIFGKLFMCFVRKGVTNPIIFLDEAGDYINKKDDSNTLVSILKLILDPASRTISVYGDQFELDISRATFILAGNSRLKDTALKSRVPQIEFDSLEQDQKRHALELAIKEDREHLKPILNEKEFRRVLKEVQKYTSFMLDLNEKMGIPGARILQQVVHELPSYIRLLMKTHGKVEKRKVEDYIKRSFEMRVSSEPVEEEENKPSPKTNRAEIPVPFPQ